MQHQVFGPIERNEEMGRWSGRVQLDVFSDYDTSAAASERLDPLARSGVFELNVIGRDRGQPSAGQERGFRDFLTNRDRACQRVIEAIFNHYVGHWGDWRATREPGQEFSFDDILIPELSDREGLKRLIRFEALSLLDTPEDAPAILGFCFDCTWDHEHGLGVLVRGGKVIEIGENDITWRDAVSVRRGKPPEAATPQRIALQRGIAAVKTRGGVVTVELDEAEEPSVQVDWLRNTRIDDADLNALSPFPSLYLKHLRICSDQVTDRGIDLLGKFKALQWLQISGAQITDAALNTLRGLKTLKILSLSGTKASDGGLKTLRGLSALAGLYLNETDVTDLGLKEIGALTGLKHLELAGNRVTDAGLHELRKLRALLTLDLQGTQVTDAGLNTLKEFPSLRYLNLSRCNVTDLGLTPLKALTALRSLKVASTATTHEGVADLRQAIPGLQVVS